MADDTGSLLTAVRDDLAAGRLPPARVRNALVCLDDPSTARTIGRLLDRSDIAPGDLTPVPVTIAATCTIGALEPLLRTALVGAGLWPTVTAAPYGTFDMTLTHGDLSGGGEEPQVLVCLMDESYFLPGEWDPVDLTALEKYVTARAASLQNALAQRLARTPATAVLHTIPLPAEVRDSVISYSDRARLCRLWNRLNDAILDIAETQPQVTVVDLVSALADAPYPARDDRLYRYGDLPYTDGALMVLAREVRRVVQARAGRSRKVLALDLDGTLWGGVLGEVGAAGVCVGGLYPGNCYAHLQRAALRLRAQGVVLVLVSKNDPELVRDALTAHPEVLLRPDRFSVVAVNWSAKSGNLRQAADSLGLSTGSFVFMDDSRFEREQVAADLPEVALVAADGDPAFLVRSLLRHGWFDVPELTDADRQRPRLYRARALRTDFSTGFQTPEQYLHALDLELVVRDVGAFAFGRVAQLAARTNQFNLSGSRPDAAAVARMSADDGWLVVSFEVNDRFGAEGIVGAAWVRLGEVWRVENLVLSCRVLGRGIETAIVGWIVGRAGAAGVERLEGRFVPSGANSVARAVWTDSGFTPTDEPGVFAVDLTQPRHPVPAWVRIREGSP
jgi:FkbH-like protein